MGGKILYPLDTEKQVKEKEMKKKLILLLLTVGLAALALMGCETFDYSSSGCSRSSGCNAIIYCGEYGCAGYWGGKCDC